MRGNAIFSDNMADVACLSQESVYAAVACLGSFHLYPVVHDSTSNLLADSVGVNPVVVRNVLGMLKSAGLVRVEPGVGGATLAKAPEDITLLDVFRAVEDEGELFRFHEPPNTQCPVGRNVHDVLGGKLDEADRAMEAELASVTLQDIADETRERMKAQGGKDAREFRE